MLKNCIKKKAWLIYVLVLVLLIIIGQEAYCQNAELIWLETEGIRATIYFAEYRNNGWSSKQKVVSRKGLIVTPSVASRNESRMAVWVTVDEHASLFLGYSISKNGKWLAPKELHFDFQETTAPSLIVFNNTYYLFFAGNSQGDDDIYMSFFVDNDWTEPVMVHPDNNVPDILPQPGFVDGALTLTWQHFDGDLYIYSSQTIAAPFSPALDKIKFQGMKPEKHPHRRIARNSPKILRDKFQIGLPADFKGLGLASGYARNEKENPAFHFTAESY